MFLPTMRTIETEVDSLDELVLILKESEATDMLRRMGRARRRVMLLHRLLVTKTDVIKTLIKRISITQQGKETALYLTDIQGELELSEPIRMPINT
jgi:magnesium transporter